MSTSVTIQTKDGRIVQGINYTVNSSVLPNDPTALAASMQGGYNYGIYHIHGPLGWLYVQASEVANFQFSAGQQT